MAPSLRIRKRPPIQKRPRIQKLSEEPSPQIRKLPEEPSTKIQKHPRIQKCSRIQKRPRIQKRSRIQKLPDEPCARIQKLPDEPCTRIQKHSQIQKRSRIQKLSKGIEIQKLAEEPSLEIQKLLGEPSPRNRKRSRIQELPAELSPGIENCSQIQKLPEEQPLQIQKRQGIRRHPRTQKRTQILKLLEKPPLQIHNLPDEMLLAIFSHLPMLDLARSVCVCRRWRSLVEGRKRLWEGKRFTACRPEHYRQLNAMIKIMPRLRSVRLIPGSVTAIHVAWPDVIVVLNDCENKYNLEPIPFRSNMLLVNYVIASSVDEFLKWVNVETLRFIHVGKQCTSSFIQWERVFTKSRHSIYCDIPDCLLHSKSPFLRQLPFRRSKRKCGPKNWLCPSLEELSTSPECLPERCFKYLCLTGPLRALVITGCHPSTLEFLKEWDSLLEILILRKPLIPFSSPLKLMEELRGLKGLKKLELSC